MIYIILTISLVLLVVLSHKIDKWYYTKYIRYTVMGGECRVNPKAENPFINKRKINV